MSKYPSQLQDKFNLRFPDGMRDAIAERAKRNGRSMNSEIVQILEDALNKESSEEILYTDNDVAELLGVSVETIQKLTSALRENAETLKTVNVALKKITKG
ncbi:MULTISPECIES: Arc family DNA-binding protein [Raoultella]|uniref:Arc family DNA-binding protein n=1 Tax=Raoultella ornithinolytica TaxID=54291 RepID=A0A9Q9N5Z9_RAOOR|nr:MULTISPECIES: Arc family DNA-binding protein [Raoultella]UXE40677.1 Arc family DNA-binding protein [Raoultella ornithinolytica]